MGRIIRVTEQGEIIMKEGMCKGCGNLYDKLQLQGYTYDIPPKPIKKLKPYCREYQLHIDSVEQVNKGESTCPFYYEK